MKRVISTILTVLMIISMLSTFAFAETVSGSCGENASWNFDTTSGVLTISGTGAINHYSYLTPPWGSYKKSIKTVIIGDGITSIGEKAFFDCTSLTSITIAGSVKDICSYAFMNCTSLTQISLGNGISTIGRRAFYFCEKLPSVTIPDSVTLIGEEAFYFCNALAQIEMGDSVATLGNSAFRGCTSLKTVNLPGSVTSIGNHAFTSCVLLKSINVDDDNTCYASEDGILLNKNKTTLIQFPAGKSNVFSIPEGVTAIADYAFYYCYSLKSVTIPDSVTYIGKEVFYNCNSLEQVLMGKGVTTIEENAFYECSSLTSIILPDSLTVLGKQAFYNCSSLTEAKIGNGKVSIGERAFCNCYFLGSITIGDNVTSIGIGAFHNTEYYNTPGLWADYVLYLGNHLIKARTPLFGNNVIRNGTKVIADCAFSECASLTGIKIPDSVTSIGNYAFEKCTSLNYVVIPDSVTSLGKSAFSGCTAIKTVRLPETISSIRESTFRDCDSLKTIIIPKNVEAIEKYAFYGSNLQSITIKNSSTNIGNSAFVCYTLTEVHFDFSKAEQNISVEANNDSFNNAIKYYNNSSVNTGGTTGSNEMFTFDPSTAVLTITGTGTLWSPGLEAAKRPLVKEVVVKGFTSISANIFNGANFTALEKVTLPDGITSLGAGAFTDCKTLKEINLPSTLTSIGNLAFYNCKALTKIDIPASVTSIGNSAFLGVVASDINFAGTRTEWEKVSIGTDNTRLSFVACSDDYRVILDKATKGDGAWIFNESKETLYFAGGTNFIKSYTEGAEMVPADIAAKVKYIDIDETLGGFGAFTFSNMPNVIEVTGGENIRYVGNYAFKNCVNLTKIELTNADYLAGIAYGMFAGCTSLESVEISDSIVFFYGRAFQYCTSLTEITVPGKVERVGEYAFLGCSNLETITLEEGITTFGAGAIQGCSALKTINFPTTLSVVGAYAFYSVPTTIVIEYAGTTAQWGNVYAKDGNATLKYLTVNFGA